MWGINPKLLCVHHLLGEHLEMHMFAGAINKGKSIQGYIDKNLVDVQKINMRHTELVKEMESRGMHHNSPLKAFYSLLKGTINIENNIKDLSDRCEKCRERIKQSGSGAVVARNAHTVEVVGPNPTSPNYFNGGCSPVWSKATACGAVNRRFKSCHPPQKKEKK